MEDNQHSDAAREERRLKRPAFNGCVREGRGEYCWLCVAMATNYTYTGETDRRKKPHKYAPFTPDANFEDWYNNNCTVDLDLTSAKLGWAGARDHYQAAIAHERQLADELAEALARASRCQFQRYYRRGDGSSYLAGDDDTEYFVKIALAKHQAARGM